uniref:NADPH-dependent FMN reductase-like domain-containing protein n=1 Tax=Odontella aurita TaxID=265563 RepID=A0A7S4I200_9STRA|mmetsp:Transcript_18564/g.53529  ORF Transcript_18564/g.53529 Transcript_18564/m.53529 type:complete len:381 (+) Transcript_18564:157-1299(+)|eukprot:CAMPEP_0113557350 /NCGR_PEP_ID=MMETSP0015_2-20120614/17745_1 /TAXON_ID=2838 /ORGANISM="Odontella" /LENGTH=380 /DNA_ID=CAMNT_0000458771 /DNA_START=131 /DNA_END=1273 /DNA_ORIENTATION=- /assembly_acc=CAM_ASM_000160
MRPLPRSYPASLLALALASFVLTYHQSAEASSQRHVGTAGVRSNAFTCGGKLGLFNLPRGGGTAEVEEEDNAEDIRIWSGEDAAAFCNHEHPGYSLHPYPGLKTGGWITHRKILASTGRDGASNDRDESGLSLPKPCWVRDEVSAELTRYNYASMPIGRPPRILILYGSLRPQSFSRKLAFEFARVLEELGCDVRVYHPHGLPVKDPSLESSDPKVAELRALTHWSDGHLWVSPEMHGTITGVFKNQIDWIPLNTGSVRPTQGKTCCVAQVNGGSQSFNAVNALRILARWMRMPCCTNQSAVPKAWREFESETGRMKPSAYRDRVVDVAEEFAKFTAIMAPVADDLTDRYSERKEKKAEGKILTQEEKERKKTVEESRKG